jgi:hypothetical protein
MTTLEEFMGGTPLKYVWDDNTWTAVYRVGTIELRCGKRRESVEMIDKIGASRFYHNIKGAMI